MSVQKAAGSGICEVVADITSLGAKVASHFGLIPCYDNFDWRIVIGDFRQPAVPFSLGKDLAVTTFERVTVVLKQQHVYGANVYGR